MVLGLRGDATTIRSAKSFWYSRHDLQCNRLFCTRPTIAAATTNTTLQSSLLQNASADGCLNPNESLSSKRGRDAPTYLPSYLRDARNVEIYHPTLRPNGAIQLSVAENYMMEDRLLPSFHDSKILTSFFPSDSIYYQPTQGREDFRRTLCSVTLPYVLQLNRTTSTSTTSTTNQPLLHPNNLIVGAGCNAVLENLCFCLASFGDGVMIPTPYYAAFEFDLTCRIGTIYYFFILPIIYFCLYISNSSKLYSNKALPLPFVAFFLKLFLKYYGKA